MITAWAVAVQRFGINAAHKLARKHLDRVARTGEGTPIEARACCADHSMAKGDMHTASDHRFRACCFSALSSILLVAFLQLRGWAPDMHAGAVVGD
jgi:hypothetical protein